MLLITGVTGHSGKYFLRELVEARYAGTVRCVVRPSSDTATIDKCGLRVEKIVGDLSDTPLLAEAMIGVDTVVHIASISYSLNVVRAALEADVDRLILVHTTGIYSRNKSAAHEYLEIERAIAMVSANSSMGIIYLRPTMIYGNVNDRNMIVFIRLVDALRVFPVINHGASLLQPVNGSDLGRAYYQVLSSPHIRNGDFILSGEKPISTLEMLESIGRLLGKRTIFVSVPLPIAVFLARSLRLSTLGRLDLVEKVQRMGEDRNYSHDRAHRDFAYQPSSFLVGLRGEVDEYRRVRTPPREARE